MTVVQPESANRYWSRPTNNSLRAAIIVGVLIGVLGIAAIVMFLWERIRKRGVKRGFRTNNQMATPRAQTPPYHDKDSSLELGVVHEPLPVYKKHAGEDGCV